jgi:HK97 family phage prohead protease
MEVREAKPGDLGGPVIGGLELRDALGGVFKDIDEGTHQVLVEFPHETVDTYKTVFGKRAFADGFEKRLPTMCWQHDIRNPIGRALEAQVTPKVNEMRGQFDDFDAVPDAKRAFHQIQSGTITDFSFGFRNAKFQPTGQRGISRITSAFMAEFSPVTIGSIPGAKAVGLREDGIITMEMAEILHLRDSGLVTFDGFRALVEEHHPELLEKIVLTDPGTRGGKPLSGATENGNPNDPDGDGDDDNPSVQWSATDAGTHTATGPNGEALRVKPVKDGDSGDVTGHKWSVTDDNGDSMGTGDSDSTDPASAKKAAFEAMMAKGKSGKREVEFHLPENPDDINAAYVRSVIEEAHPELALVLRDAAIAIGPHQNSDEERAPADPAIVAGLATQTDAALDSAVEWLREVDVAALPDPVQQSIALLQAANVSSDALVDVLGIQEPDEGRADGDYSDKPWSDFDQSDYTPEQWKAAALIKGDTDNKDDSKLPIKEPDGTLNVHGIAAAASRIDQLKDVSDEAKVGAAKALMGHYGKMKKPVPPNVLKVAGAGSRSDEEIQAEEAERKAQEDAALAKLDKRLGHREPPPASV